MAGSRRLSVSIPAAASACVISTALPVAAAPFDDVISRAFTVSPPDFQPVQTQVVSRAFTVSPPDFEPVQTQVISRAFTVQTDADDPCVLRVLIEQPSNGSVFEVGESVTFQADVAHAAPGPPAPAVAWSSIAGGETTELGTGLSITVSDLEGAPGGLVHTIVAEVVDADGMTDEDSITVTVFVPPDLVPAIVSSPQSGLTNQPFQVIWSVTNTGNAVAVGPWIDRIFLSSDPEPGNDILVGGFQNPQSLALEPGSSYQSSLTVSFLSAPGTYWLIVRADADSAIAEFSGEANNDVVSGPIVVEAQPLPDLIVTDVSAPPDGTPSGSTTSVMYTVQNIGAGGTTPSWKERIVLSTGQVLAQVNNVQILPPAGAYSREVSFTLPNDIEGPHDVVVVVDSQSVMTEEDESNNAAQSPSFEIELEPQPDLQVLDVGWEGVQGASGTPFTVTWQIINAGEASTGNGWAHQIYFSTNPFPVIDPGSDFLFATKSAAGVGELPSGLPPVSFQHEALIPQQMFGEFYVKVVADSTNAVSEHGLEHNNIGVSESQVTITLTPGPDLAPDQITATTATPYPGQTFQATWAVAKEGQDPAFPTSWQDAIYLSQDGTETFLGAFSHSSAADGTITPYTKTRTLIFPPMLEPGDYAVLVRIDFQNTLFEGVCPELCENNNTALSETITVEPQFADLAIEVIQGPPSPVTIGSTVTVQWRVTNVGQVVTPVGAWQDRVVFGGTGAVLKSVGRSGALAPGGSYTVATTVTVPFITGGTYDMVFQTDATDAVLESDEVPNSVAVPFEISGDAPDLVVTSATAPAEQTSGQGMLVGWTVQNTGTLPAVPTTWTDRVWLSDDDVPGGDMLLGGKTRTGGLTNGGTYSTQASFPIPIGLSGSFHVFVTTDASNQVFELSNGNNTGPDPAAAPQVTITLADSANLVVTEVAVEGTAISGQPLPIEWTVANEGEATTNVSTWADSLYLSLDQILGPGDTHLATIPRNGALPAGDDYTGSASPTIPLGINGLYFIIARTNSNGAVFENGRTDDNILATTVLSQVIIPSPSDLRPGMFIAPAAGVLGEPVMFEWTIENNGEEVIDGQWQDSLYLSLDPIWDLGDVKVGTFASSAPSGGLLPGESLPRTVTAAVPAVLPGLDYFLIVRSDVFNNVPETDEANNVGFSAGTMFVTANALALSEPGEEMPATGDLAAGQQKYYQLDAPPGETVLLTFSHLDDGAWTEMYVKFGAVPTPGNFDLIFGNPGEPVQQIAIPTTQAGSYFILVRVPTIIQPETTEFTLLAEKTPFSLTGVEPATIGAARATVTVSGAQFTEEASFRIRPSGTQIEYLSVRTIVADSATALVTFELPDDAPLGEYDVLAEGINDMTDELPGGLTVEPPSDFIVEHDVLGLTPGRLGITTAVTLSLTNASNRDLPVTMAALFTEAIDGLDWSVTQWTEPVSNDLWKAKLLYVKELPPGWTLEFPVTVNASVESGLEEVQYYVDAVILADLQFEDRLRDLAEAIRQQVLAGEVSVPSSLHAAAEDPDGWWNLLRPAWVVAGYLEGAGDADELLPGHVSDCTTLCDALAMIDEGLAAGCEAVCECAGADACECPAFPPCTGEGELDGGPANGRGLPCNLPVCFGAGDPAQLGGGALDCGPAIACQAFTQGDDPNEKDGERGFGEVGWLGQQQEQSYVVFFENLADATAPAARVEITDPLDLDLNPATFQVGEIVIGSDVIEVPPGQIVFSQTVDLVESRGVLLQIFAAVNVATDPPQAIWILQSIDPETGEPPTDGVTGFLPPNDASGEGRGHVTFTIDPKPGLASLTTIENNAEIVFDVNQPIGTSTVVNTIDADPPGSGLSPLPPVVEGPEIEIAVSGDDVGEGSGLASFNLLVSVDGGALTPFSFSTGGSVTFQGEAGHVYGFSSQAVDNAGNLEPIDATADVVTAIPSVALAEASDSGVPGDAITNDDTPSFVAVSAPLSDVVVEIFDSGQSLVLSDVAQTGVNGRATYTVPDAQALADGLYTIVTTAFGVSAETQVTIDTAPPVILAWESAADHGLLGEVTLPISPNGATSEARATGVSRVLLRFAPGGDDVASLVPGSVTIEGRDVLDQPIDVGQIDVTITARTGESTLELAFSPPLPDQALYCLTLAGLGDPAGNQPAPEQASRLVTALLGDASGDRRVNNTDVGGVISLLGIDPIDPAEPFQVASDVDTDGAITDLDLAIVLAARGPDARFIESPCPIIVVGADERYGDPDALDEANPIDGDMIVSAEGAGAATGATPPPEGAPLVGLPEQPELDDRDDRASPETPWWSDRPPDPDRIAIFDPTAAGGLAPWTGLVPPGARVTSLPLRGWWMVEMLDAAALREPLLAAGPYVSPVLPGEEPDSFVIVPPTILVAFAPELSRDDAEQTLRRSDPGCTIVEAHVGGLGAVHRVETSFRDAFDVLAALEALRDSDGIVFAEPDMIFSATHTARVSGTKGWIPAEPPTAEAGSRIVVALLDDGVEADHPGLSVQGSFEASTTDEPGWARAVHGTAVAGLIASEGVTLVSAKVTAALEIPGTWISRVSWTLDALDWARRHGARITVTPVAYGYPSRAIALAYDRSREAGVLHFAAAGDDSQRQVLAFPASLASVMAVGAVDMQRRPAAFSRSGAGLAWVAGGVDRPTADRTGPDGYADGSVVRMSGTAFATAVAADAAARLWGARPDLDADRLEALLWQRALDLGDPGPDERFGRGLLDPAAVVPRAGDLTGDGRIDVDDLVAVIDTAPPNDPRGDLNGDGTTDALDVLKCVELLIDELARRR